MTDTMKDELATEEMIAMMESPTESPSEPPAKSPEKEAQDMESLDDLLTELEEVEATPQPEEAETPPKTEIPPTSEETEVEPEVEPLAIETLDDASPVVEDVSEPASEKVTPSQAIQELQEAIHLRDELKALSQTIHEHTEETTLLTIATARKAQEEAEQIQQEIDQAIQASEKAIEILKSAGYQSDDLPSISPEQIPEFFAEIHAKNEALKRQNEALKSRLTQV